MKRRPRRCDTSRAIHPAYAYQGVLRVSTGACALSFLLTPATVLTKNCCKLHMYTCMFVCVCVCVCVCPHAGHSTNVP